MRLFEHPDFDQIIVRTAANLGIREQFVEKDYHVTEVLRIVEGTLGDKVIFKGGTSLSKGWNLTTRFSEDIDLFIDPQRFNPPLGTRRIDRTLETLATEVADHPALTWQKDEAIKHKGSDRSDYFSYQTQFDALPGIRSAVLLEPGIQSGDFPWEVRPITSLVADFLLEDDRHDLADDLQPFEMTLLHFRRTFVEKLFTVDGKVTRLMANGGQIGRHARHYADLFTLAGTPEVKNMLSSDEFKEIRLDYDEKSRRFYPKFYRPPDDLSFRDSPALFPSDDLRAQLAGDYEKECSRLFSGGDYPAFDAVLARLQETRDLL